jgi:hypothetical protein
MDTIDAIDMINAKLDQAATLVEMIGNRDFGKMSDEARANYVSILAESIEQAKIAAALLKVIPAIQRARI